MRCELRGASSCSTKWATGLVATSLAQPLITLVATRLAKLKLLSRAKATTLIGIWTSRRISQSKLKEARNGDCVSKTGWRSTSSATHLISKTPETLKFKIGSIKRIKMLKLANFTIQTQGKPDAQKSCWMRVTFCIILLVFGTQLKQQKTQSVSTSAWGT